MAIITTINEINSTGIEPLVYSNASVGGDKYLNVGNLFVVIVNGGSETSVVTFTAQTTSFDSPVYGPAVKNPTIMSIAAGRTAYVGPMEPNAFNDEDGNVNITYSVHTGVTLAVCVVNNN
jgi:hypothetical protein